MPRRGECIYKRKDGRWEARYVKEIGADGKKKYASVYANSYRDVKDKQQYFMLTPAVRKYSPSNVTVADLSQRWLGHIKPQVKPATYRKYEGLCRNHIDRELGGMPLMLITRKTVEDFSEKLLLSGKVGGGELSAKTVNDILIILGLCFEFFHEEYGIDMPKISFLRTERKEARVLSDREQKKLLDYLLSDTDVYKFGVLLALYTGIRIGELCALRWEDVKENHLVIDKTMQRLKSDTGKTEIVIGSPKSESSKRVVPLPDFLIPHVESFRRATGYVIHTDRCVHTEPRIFQQKFKSMADKCGIGGATFHTLRHTFATRCVEVGFDIKTLSEILGHSDVKTTLNRYVHSSFELKQNNMAKLSLAINI